MTVGSTARSGRALVYLNVTPKQGGETLANWTGSRLEHLREDGQYRVHLDSASPALRFRGGSGRCVIDNYTTKLHNNRYAEIACIVRGPMLRACSWRPPRRRRGRPTMPCWNR